MENKKRRIKEFGEHIKFLRTQKNVSVRKVAATTGLSDPYLYQVEAGKKAVTDPNNFHSLAEYFNVPVIQLLEKAGYMSSYWYRSRVLDVKRTAKKITGKQRIEYRCEVIVEEMGRAAHTDIDRLKTHVGKEEVIKFAKGIGTSTYETNYSLDKLAIDEPELLKKAIYEAKKKACRELSVDDSLAASII